MKAAKPKDTATSRWLSYRPEIKVVDCTIRDGGLMNNHQFDDKIVKVVYDTCVAAGMDYMEIGYKASRKGIKAGEHGCWKYCHEEDIRRIVGDNQTRLETLPSWPTPSAAITTRTSCPRRNPSWT